MTHDSHSTSTLEDIMTEQHAEHEHTHADGTDHVHPHGLGHHDGETPVEHHEHEHTHADGTAHAHEHGDEHHS